MRCGATAGCWARPSPAPAACWPAHSRPWPDPVTGSSAASSRTATRPRSTSWTCRPTRSIISARSANRWRWKWPPACCWRRRPRTWRCRPPASPDRAAPRRASRWAWSALASPCATAMASAAARHSRPGRPGARARFVGDVQPGRSPAWSVPDALNHFGAVSEPVALEMATGVLAAQAAHVGVDHRHRRTGRRHAGAGGHGLLWLRHAQRRWHQQPRGHSCVSWRPGAGAPGRGGIRAAGTAGVGAPVNRR